ncbi:MAG: PAS domain S-box protein [Gemmatimonadaceae bacterium]
MNVIDVTRMIGLFSLSLVLLGWALIEIFRTPWSDWDSMTVTIVGTGLAGAIYATLILLRVSVIVPDPPLWTFKSIYFALALTVFGLPSIYKNVWYALQARRHGEIRAGTRHGLAPLVVGEGIFASIASALPVVIADNNGTIQYATASLDALVGTAPDELSGQQIVTLMPESWRARHLMGIQHDRETKEPNILGTVIEVELLRRDGSIIPVSLALTSADVDGEEWFIGTLWRSSRNLSVGKMKEEMTTTEKAMPQ